MSVAATIETHVIVSCANDELADIASLFDRITITENSKFL